MKQKRSGIGDMFFFFLMSLGFCCFLLLFLLLHKYFLLVFMHIVCVFVGIVLLVSLDDLVFSSGICLSKVCVCLRCFDVLRP